MSGHAYSAPVARSRRLPGRIAPSSPQAALGLAALCVVALGLVWVVAELVPQAHFRDAVVLHDFMLLSGPRVDPIGELLLHPLDVLPFTIWGVALVAIALARERPRVAVAAATIMSMAPLSTEILKPLTAHTHLRMYAVQIGPVSWPSGHSTAALALVLAALLVTPARLRPYMAVVGALYAAAVGCFLLILSWHMPSDVVAGYLMATLWAALAVAALRAAELRWPTHKPI
jgi:membrane-associated phospholipid phosphatase